MTNVNNQSGQQTKVVDLTAFKKKKDVEKEISRARRPLYVNSQDGTVSGKSSTARSSQASSLDVPDRLVKIRSSLDRINQLMSEIKKLSANHGNSERQ